MIMQLKIIMIIMYGRSNNIQFTKSFKTGYHIKLLGAALAIQINGYSTS